MTRSCTKINVLPTLILAGTTGRIWMRTTLAVLNKVHQDATQTVLMALKSLERKESEHIELATLQSYVTDNARDCNDGIPSPVTLGSILSKENFSTLDLEMGKLFFQGRIYSPNLEPSPLRAIGDEVSSGPEKAIERIIDLYEGDFALVIAEPKRIVAGRDPVGVQPLYYGENSSYVAVGTNRTALWKIGIKDTRSFPPGNMGVANDVGFRFKEVKSLKHTRQKQTTLQDSYEALLKMIERSVHVRVRGEREVAVAFSGGLDSSIVAFQAKKSSSVQLVHVSLEGQTETEEAKRAADELGLPLSVYLFREEDVAATSSKVVELIEEPNPIKTEVGIAFYWTAQKTAEAGFKVLLAGQGADELFGGYQRYAKEYFWHGEERVMRMMFGDIKGIHESNIERDKKVCNYHDIELRLPFASYQMAEFAASLPVQLKLDCRLDSPRKLVLRKVAEKMGLPQSIVSKPKKAVQYGTGIDSALKRIAKKRKTTIHNLLATKFFDRS